MIALFGGSLRDPKSNMRLREGLESHLAFNSPPYPGATRIILAGFLRVRLNQTPPTKVDFRRNCLQNRLGFGGSLPLKQTFVGGVKSGRGFPKWIAAPPRIQTLSGRKSLPGNGLRGKPVGSACRTRSGLGSRAARATNRILAKTPPKIPRFMRVTRLPDGTTGHSRDRPHPLADCCANVSDLPPIPRRP